MDAPPSAAVGLGGVGSGSRSPAPCGALPAAVDTSGPVAGTGAPASTTSSSPNILLPAASVPKRKTKRIELSEDQRLEIKEAFELFDCDKTGFIGFYELKVCLRAFGFSVKKPEIMELRREFDKRQTGQLSYADFSEIFTRYIMERDPLDEIRKAFRLFDDEGTGKISLKQLRRVSRELGENLSDEELQAMIDEFDTDNDGEINEDEFIAIMTQSTLL